MNTIARFMICLIAICFFGIPKVYGKRSAPKLVQPVFYNGLKITAPRSKKAIVIAQDVKTGEMRWEKQIYKVRYIPFLEKDVQEIYITTLQIDGHNLIITDEKKRRFQLNFETRKVVKLK